MLGELKRHGKLREQAVTQHNLGNALWNQGTRAAGTDGDGSMHGDGPKHGVAAPASVIPPIALTRRA